MRTRLVLVLMVVLALASCTAAEDEEVTLGSKLDSQVLSTCSLVEDAQVVSRVSQIGVRLIKQSERPEMTYAFRVLDSKEVVAFAGAGGYVYISSAMYDICQTDDELAAILAHEIAHCSLGHVMKTRREIRKMKKNFLITLADFLTDGWASKVSGLGILKHSRESEVEADERAFEYMFKAGFDPIGIVAVFDYFANITTAGDNLVFLSTHPEMQKRYDKYVALVAEKRLRETMSAFSLPPCPCYRVCIEVIGSEKSRLEGSMAAIKASCRKTLGENVAFEGNEQLNIQGSFNGALSLKLTIVAAEQPTGSLNIVSILWVWDPISASSPRRGVVCRWVEIKGPDLDKRLSESVCSSIDELLMDRTSRSNAAIVVRQGEVAAKRYDLIALAFGKSVPLSGPYYLTRDGKVIGQGHFDNEEFVLDEGTVKPSDILIIRP